MFLDLNETNTYEHNNIPYYNYKKSDIRNIILEIIIIKMYRHRKIIGFNPPFRKLSNIGKYFLNLIDKHFKKNIPPGKSVIPAPTICKK